MEEQKGSFINRFVLFIKKYDKKLRVVLSISKFITFFGLIYAFFIMYYIGQQLTAIMILYALGFYLIYNKIESIQRRI